MYVKIYFDIPAFYKIPKNFFFSFSRTTFVGKKKRRRSFIVRFSRCLRWEWDEDAGMVQMEGI